MTIINVKKLPWLMEQTWRDLLFAHWPVSWESLRAQVPETMELDRWEGAAWLGVVPFRMTGIRPLGMPAVPYLSDTLELNVRTYVTVNGKPGVYFFSLDAERPIAVRIARRFFFLPYFDAQMECSEDDGALQYSSRRTHRGAAPAEFAGTYSPVGDGEPAAEGTLPHFLTARYCLYTQDRTGALVRGDIQHDPWTLQPARAEFQLNTMAAPLGFRLDEPPASLLFSRLLEVKIQGIARC